MRLLLERILGVAVIGAVSLGLLLTAAGFYAVSTLQPSIKQGTAEILNVLDAALVTTMEALEVVERSLDNAAETMTTLETTTRDVAKGIGETDPLFDTLTTVTGKDLPATVANTQQSLASAAEAAQTIETHLTTLSQIPLLNVPTYRPEVPLEESLTEVQSDLEPLTDAFLEMEESINVGGENSAQVEKDIQEVADSIAQINPTIEQAKEVVSQFEQIVLQQQAIILMLKTNLDLAIRWTGRIAYILLTWFGIIQSALFFQGTEMANRGRNKDKESN